MKFFIYSLAIVSLMTACNSGGGSSGTPQSEEDQIKEAASAVDHTANVSPASFTVLKANMTVDEQKEAYTIGCEKQGESSRSTYEIDHQLATGQVFKHQLEGGQISGNDFFVIEENTITNILADKILINSNYEQFKFSGLPFASPAEVFTKKPHFQIEEILVTNQNGTKDPDRKTTVQNLTPAAQNYLKNNPQSSTSISCHVDYNQKDAKSVSEFSKISYNLNGRSITAYLRKNSREGNIICEKHNNSTTGAGDHKPTLTVSMGPGRDDYTEIQSNEVISAEFLGCGGINLFRASKTSLNAGKVLNSFVEKTLAAPVR